MPKRFHPVFILGSDYLVPCQPHVMRVERMHLSLMNGPKGIPLDNKAFLGSAVPERPSCIVPAAARHRFGSPVMRQAGGFVAWTVRCPKKNFLPGAAGNAPLRCGPARVKVSCGRGTCTRIKIFRFGAGIQKTQITSDRLFLTSTTHIFYSCINIQISLIYISRS